MCHHAEKKRRGLSQRYTQRVVVHPFHPNVFGFDGNKLKLLPGQYVF